MKIAMAVSFPLDEISGTPIHARTIARLLGEKGDEVFVLATENRKSTKIMKETLDNFTIYRLPLWLSPLLSFALLAREKPEVISIQAQGALASVALPARLLGIPLVYEVHGLFRDEMAYTNGGRASWRARFYDLAERLALPQVRRVVVLSEKVRRVYIQELNLPATMVDMFYPAVHFAQFQEIKDLPGVRALKAQVRGRQVVMYAGSLYPAQGIDLLAEAIPLILAQAPRTVFVFVGDEPKAEFAKLLDKIAPFRDHIVILSYQPHADIPSYLAVADVLVIPRPDIPLNRVSPRKMCEYLAMGKPVVATDVADFRQVFAAHRAGLVTACTSAGLAEGLLKVLQEEALRKQLGDNARDAARRHFDFATVIGQYRAIYHASSLKPLANPQIKQSCSRPSSVSDSAELNIFSLTPET